MFSIICRELQFWVCRKGTVKSSATANWPSSGAELRAQSQSFECSSACRLYHPVVHDPHHGGQVPGSQSRSELISQPWDSHDQQWPLWVIFNFLPQAGDMNIHGAGKRLGAVGPHLLQQQITGERYATVLDKIPQELEFAGGER